MKLRSLTAALLAGACLSVTSPAIAETGIPPVTVPPLPVPIPPLPPVPPVPPLPVPTPAPAPTPAPPTLPPLPLPDPPPGAGAGGGLSVPSPAGTPSPSTARPGLPGSGSVLGAAATPTGTDPGAVLGALGAVGSLPSPTGQGLPGGLAAFDDLRDTASQIVTTVTTSVCQVLQVIATNLQPVTAAVGAAVSDLPTSSLGAHLGTAVGFRLQLQALSQLPASTLLTLSASLPGLLTIDLALPNCPEGTPTGHGPGGQGPGPGLGSELIPPSSTARVLQIAGSPVSVTRPAPALPANPGFTG